MEPTPARPTRHSLIDDAQGLAFGSFMASVGVLLLTHLGLVTGQTAGLALLIAYATGWGFGPVFFVVNLPFYWLGYRRLGLAFMIKSFRHGASLGGIGIVALYLQDATGFRAGWTQLIFDACLFGLALFVRDWQAVAWSALGALVLNLVIALNHRRDRYIA
jgi:uncharacterized membrane-anchored protein YitT (DUF2179 family)